MRKGFAQIIVIILLMVLVGGAVYYFEVQKGKSPPNINPVITTGKKIDTMDTNKILYVDSNGLFVYDLTNHTNKSLFISPNNPEQLQPYNTTLSPDQSKILLDVQTKTNPSGSDLHDIWVYDLLTNTSKKLTTAIEPLGYPQGEFWSSDSKTIYYTSKGKNGNWSLFAVGLSGTVTPLLQTGNILFAHLVNNNLIAYRTAFPESYRQSQIGIFDIKTNKNMLFDTKVEPTLADQQTGLSVYDTPYYFLNPNTLIAINLSAATFHSVPQDKSKIYGLVKFHLDTLTQELIPVPVQIKTDTSTIRVQTQSSPCGHYIILTAVQPGATSDNDKPAASYSFDLLNNAVQLLPVVQGYSLYSCLSDTSTYAYSTSDNPHKKSLKVSLINLANPNDTKMLDFTNLLPSYSDCEYSSIVNAEKLIQGKLFITIQRGQTGQTCDNTTNVGLYRLDLTNQTSTKINSTESNSSSILLAN